MHPKYWKFPNRNVKTFGFVYPDTNGQSHGPVWKSSRSSWKESVRSSFGRTIVGKAIWEYPIETRMGENSKLGMSLCSSWKGLFLSVYADDINWLDGNKILIRCDKYSTKKSNLGEPTSFLDHVYLDRTQQQCEIRKDIVDNYRTMFESRISAG